MSLAKAICWLINSHVPRGRVELKDARTKESTGYVQYYTDCARCGKVLENE